MAEAATDSELRSRPLGELEKFFAIREMATTCGMRTVGDIDLAALEQAFAALAQQNPVLYGRVVEGPGGFVLEQCEPRALPFTVRAGVPDEYLEEFSPPLDQRQFLARLDVVHAGTDAAVSLTFNHTVADGNASGAMIMQFWANYTSIVRSGFPLDIPSRPVPFPPEAVLHAADGPPIVRPAAGDAPPSVTPLTGAVSHLARFRITLSKSETDALVHFAKNAATTVHAAVAGAVLVAERSLITADGPQLLLAMSSVDFRAALPRPIDVLDGTNFVGMVISGVAVDKNDAPIAIGRQVVDHIRAEVEAGRPMYGALQPALPPEEMTTLPPMSFISNVGRIPAFVTPAELQITDLRFIMPNQPRPGLMYAVFTYGGRMYIEVTYPADGLSPERVGQLRQAVTGNLVVL